MPRERREGSRRTVKASKEELIAWIGSNPVERADMESATRKDLRISAWTALRGRSTPCAPPCSTI
jgi:hypothetical protein